MAIKDFLCGTVVRLFWQLGRLQAYLDGALHCRLSYGIGQEVPETGDSPGGVVPDRIGLSTGVTEV